MRCLCSMLEAHLILSNLRIECSTKYANWDNFSTLVLADFGVLIMLRCVPLRTNLPLQASLL